MEYHPIANVWPLVEGQKFDELVADIKAHGLRQPIIIYQGKVLDGRNRERACIAGGVKPRYEPAKAKNDEEALALSASLNKHRRHMSPTDLAFVAAELSKFSTKAWNKRSDLSEDRSHPIITAEDAAKAVGIGVASVFDAKVLNKPKHADIKQEVLDKKLSLRDGATKARAKAKPKAPQPTTAEVIAINAKKAAGYARRNLTRQDVDPEFVGDEIAFVTEYGHVWMQTSEERSTSRMTTWAIAMRQLARTFNTQPELPRISPTVLSWLRKPRQADVDSLQASLADLELAVATARTLLERARSAMAESQVTS